MKISLHDNHDIQTTYEVKIFRYSLRWTFVTQLHYGTMNRKCVSYRQEMVQTIVLNGSVGHFLTWHQSYCSRYSYTPRMRWFSIPMQKNAKNEDFLISSIIYTAVNFEVFCYFLICYSVFWWQAVKSDSNPVFSNVRRCFCVFCIN